VVGGGRGVQFRDLLPLLVLLARGTREEKIKFLYGVIANDGMHIEKGECLRQCAEWEGELSSAHISSLFAQGDKVNFETFNTWIEKNYEGLETAKWLLSPNNSLSLICHLETPTFYQTLAGVTHLSEVEVIELEKRFWSLVGNSPSGRIDISIITPLVTPPLPPDLVPGLFRAFDENQDGHLDFKELSCGVSAACRGPVMERQIFCFKIFDGDRDGLLSRAETNFMINVMLQISENTDHKLTKSKTGSGDNI